MARTFIDLHTHSTASDGSDSPEELIHLAKKSNVTTLALTDHDTVAGVEEAMETGKELGVDVIAGCELGVKTDFGEIHLLGLWLDPKAPKLQKIMSELRSYRSERNKIIVEKLQALGMNITYEEVLEAAGDGSVGRPHIAQVLVEKKYFKSVKKVFEEMLCDGGKAYAPKKVLSPIEGVKLLKEEGATVSWAHMCIHGQSTEYLNDMIATLKPHGLDALEAYHSEHGDASTRLVVELAAVHGLALTGGSDYHGAVKPNIAIGRGKGGLYVPHSVLDNLKELRRKQGLPV